MHFPKFKVRSLTHKVYFTVETLADLPEFPEGPLIELIEGDLFMVPSPTIYHQRISRNLLVAIAAHLKKTQVGEVLSAPVDVVLSEETLVIPDIVVVLNENTIIIKEKNIVGSPDLIIEFLSTNRAQDLELKREIYEQSGVREYWVIEPAERAVLKFVQSASGYSEPEVVYEVVVSDLLGLRLAVGSIFE